MTAVFQASAPIKLVIWDLDDTFWNGTLSEGEVELVDRNIEIVRTLVDRGIMSSICSKNAFEPVRERLTEAGIWDLFIFPQIAFAAKGQAVQSIIEQANLRPANVLFVDDNHVNLEEVRFLCPEIMVALPTDVLPQILDLKETSGKDDRVRSRLAQYKKLEQKVQDIQKTSLSNEDFLRQCEISVRFEYDIEPHFDRIVELVSRSNQLNFTKCRLDSKSSVEEFRHALKQHNVFSAAIFASDKYGDHGLIGFYMFYKNERYHQLVHFVFSCRIMNMGVEQFVYERIKRPNIDIVQPVSNDICCFDTVDWIAEKSVEETKEVAGASPRLVLLGSCDLTAVATYCSTNRAEYVNSVVNGVTTRVDDFGFILNNPERVARSTALPMIPCWQNDAFQSFRSDLQSSDVIILSLSAAMRGAYLVTDDDVVVRVHPRGLGDHIDYTLRVPFMKRVTLHTIDDKTALELLAAALGKIRRESSAKHVFLLGANTRQVDGAITSEEASSLQSYNAACAAFCNAYSNWSFVDIDQVVPSDYLVDDSHYTRLGYFEIAKYINATIAVSPTREHDMARSEVWVPKTEYADIASVIRAGKRRTRLTLMGSHRGHIANIKRAVELTPVSRLVRKAVGKPVLDPGAVANVRAAEPA